MKQQSTPLGQRLWAFLFPELGKLDIHEPLTSRIGKATLKRFRLASWVVLSTCLILLLRSTQSNFALVFDIGKSMILSWLYFSLVVQDRWINQNSLAKTMNISLRLKYYVEAAYEIALSVQLPVSVFGLLSVFKESSSGGFAAVSSIELINLTIPLICLLLDFAANTYRFSYRRVALLLPYLLTYLVSVLLYSDQIGVTPLTHNLFHNFQSYLHNINTPDQSIDRLRVFEVEKERKRRRGKEASGRAKTCSAQVCQSNERCCRQNQAGHRPFLKEDGFE